MKENHTMVAKKTDYSDVFPNPNESLPDVLPAHIDELPEGPWVAVVDDDYYGSEGPRVLAAKGVTLIRISPDALDPWYAETLDEVDEAEDGIRQAIALVAAGDNFEAQGLREDDKEYILEDLQMILHDTIPGLRAEIEAWEEREIPED